MNVLSKFQSTHRHRQKVSEQQYLWFGFCNGTFSNDFDKIFTFVWLLSKTKLKVLQYCWLHFFHQTHNNLLDCFYLGLKRQPFICKNCLLFFFPEVLLASESSQIDKTKSLRRPDCYCETNLLFFKNLKKTTNSQKYQTVCSKVVRKYSTTKEKKCFKCCVWWPATKFR